MENKNIIWYIVGAVAIVLLIAVVVGMNSNSPSLNSANDVQVNTAGTNNTVTNPNTDSNPNTGTDSAPSASEEISAEEEERLETIESAREALLAEQAALDEAQQNVGASSSELSLEELERQNQIDLELLELQNQEEYPPLPDPGV